MSSLEPTNQTLPPYIFLQSHPEVDLLDAIRRINGHVLTHPREHVDQFESWFAKEIFPIINTEALHKATKTHHYLSRGDWLSVSNPLKIYDAKGLVNAIMECYEDLWQKEDGYRTAPVYIFNTEKLMHRNDQDKETFFNEHWDNYFNNLPEPDQIIWNGMRTRIYQHHFEKPPQDPNLQDNEISLLLRHGYITNPCTSPKELEKETKKFAEELCNRLKTEMDRFKLMAFVHCNLARLHIKSNGNGRVARFLMHVTGWEKGQTPIIIKDSQKYHDHATSEEKLEADLRTWAQEQQTLFDSLAPSTMEKINSMVLAIDRDRRERLDQKIRLGVDFEDIQSFIESNLF